MKLCSKLAVTVQLTNVWTVVAVAGDGDMTPSDPQWAPELPGNSILAVCARANPL